jgi:hypothetical protein
MGKRWWEYIHIWLMAVATEEKCASGRKGSQTLSFEFVRGCLFKHSTLSATNTRIKYMY